MDKLPKWTPFVPGYAQPYTEAQVLGVMKAFPGKSRADIITAFEEAGGDNIWLNSRYQVNVRAFKTAGIPMLHLSIKKLDKTRVGPERYRDFMRIKDELVGPEYEAIEIYPARSRETDTANQYHLWVVQSEGYRFPCGFNDGRNVTGPIPGANVGQHPFEED